MKRFWLIFSGLSIMISCSSDTSRDRRHELIPDPEKYAHDGYNELPDSLKPIFEPDTAVGQVSLMNPENIEAYLGKDALNRLEEEGRQRSSVLSSDGQQRLTFYFQPGKVEKGSSAFQVEYVDQTQRDDRKATDQEFETENGIKLGMTMGSLRALKGEPDSVANDQTTVFYYQTDDANFLQKFSMPAYDGNYTFSDGYLIAFKFGFAHL